MKITLVSMPWQSFEWPSLGISTLDTLLTEHGHTVRQFYANVAFSDFVLEQTGGEITPEDYRTVYEDGYLWGVGEWVFTSALYGRPWNVGRYRSYLQETEYPAADIDKAVRLHSLVPGFVREAAAEILEHDPDMVGISTVFDQNVSSLALAQEIKRRSPATRVVFGGGNCDGEMGAALHANYRFVDYVVRGEGERPLIELLTALETGGRLDRVKSLCWRGEDGESRVNPYMPLMTAARDMRQPQFGPFFDAFPATASRSWIANPSLRLETSRGCWWGEKRQCTFCGLNGGSLNYRVKDPEVALAELMSSVERHEILDVWYADDILDPSYFDDGGFFDQIAELDWDLRMFYEVKSNLKPDQIAKLYRAGVVKVQPGIESLSTTVLKLMEKGASGPGQVAALRAFVENGVYPVWNYLYGFPGEDWDRDYAPVVDQVRALHHLPPPETSLRIKLERFSPLFENPELGVDDGEPDAWYPLVYDLPHDQLRALAYMYTYADRGITAEQAKQLHDANDTWSAAYEHSSLTYRTRGDTVTILDRRQGWARRDLELTGLAAITYLTLSRPLNAAGLRATVEREGHTLDAEQLADWLASWKRDGLVYEDHGTWTALAMTANLLRKDWSDDRHLAWA